ncbi:MULTISPECIES: hypothetical protein [unclassified Ochrobactrum]|jgi:hypothetical protein|uniref:hypothetical protein n=1 Tax=unclassified Ochrobactrum TaxID=239106 RepID=UPI0013B38B05|nr:MULTISPECIES: hypothetical protein [unclassified Ochrobactrum]MBQ0711134.1 hypothetical protein [Ochrobactrum sp. AP1BH01-1]
MSNVTIVAHSADQSNLHVFGVRADGTGGHTFDSGTGWQVPDWQVTNWSQPTDGLVSVPVAIVGPQPNILLAFAVNRDNNLCISQSDTTETGDIGWTKWTPIAENWYSAPVVARNNGTTYQLLSRAANGEVRVLQTTDAAQTWNDTSIGGNAYGTPAVAALPTQSDAVCRWPDGSFYHSYCTSGGAWSDWSKVGDQLVTDPTAVYRTQDQNHILCVFGLGVDNCVHYSFFQNGSWVTGIKLTGPVLQKPVAVASGANLDLFGVKPDGTVIHGKVRYMVNWNGWEELDGIKAICQPAATIHADGTVDLVVTDFSNTVYVRSLKNDIWQPNWINIGQGLQVTHLLQGNEIAAIA